jgi:hypothetical protein
MKSNIIYLLFIVFSANAQKSDALYLNDLQTIDNTSFVVSVSQNHSKLGDERSSKLVFINTETGITNEVEFPKDSNVHKVFTTVTSKYLNTDFILVEASRRVEKTLPKANNVSRELFLIKLDTFKVVKLSTANFSLISWVINNNTNTLVVLERENGFRNGYSSVQKIVTIKLETGNATEVFKIN